MVPNVRDFSVLPLEPTTFLDGLKENLKPFVLSNLAVEFVPLIRISTIVNYESIFKEIELSN